MASSHAGDDRSAAQHGTMLTAGMRRLWKEDLLCDVKLCVGSLVFHVHRTMLVALSEYFRAMFTGSFCENSKSEIELKEVSENAMIILMDYVYSGTVEINAQNLEDVLHAASLFQFQQVLQFCEKYMATQVADENCICLKLSERYDVPTCFCQIKLHILHNFVAVSKQATFGSISLDFLFELLIEEKLHSERCELAVFQAICEWLEANKSTLDLAADATAYRLLSLVRYELMTSDEMAEVYRAPVMRSPSCWPIMQAALDVHMKSKQSKVPIDNRHVGLRIRIIGAKDVQHRPIAQMLQLECGDRDSNVEIRMRDENAYQYTGGCVAQRNGVVYIVGECSNKRKVLSTKMIRYNLRSGHWRDLSSMSTPRSRFVLIAQTDYLVAIGGRSTNIPTRLDLNILDTCERYDINSNSWHPFPSLPKSTCGHSGCWSDKAGKMYISGGWNGIEVYNTLLSFDGCNWTNNAPMLSPRCNHVMVAYNDELIVCAGRTGIEPMGKEILTVEMYNTFSNDWTEIKTFVKPQRQLAPAAVICKSYVYILGGWQNNKPVDIVQCYDLKKKDWKSVNTRLPSAMAEVLACTI